MKRILIPLIFYVSGLLSNESESNLFINDYPIWLEIPTQTIEEDCTSGCTDGIFTFNLEPFIDDPDGDIITILEPDLISGQVQELYVDSFLLNILPSQNFFGNIVIELTADDGELSSSTQFILDVQPINDAPVWLEIEEQNIGEDCSYGCENNLFLLNLEPYFYDSDDDIITLLGPVLISGEVEQIYVSSYNLYIELVDNFFGTINVQVVIDDGQETTNSNVLINVESINDLPSFSNLGDIIFDEDQTYQENWAFDISGGPENESQSIFFTVTFSNEDLIESYTLSPNGQFFIEPSINENGTTSFSVAIIDSEFDQSETFNYNLTINPINDNPTINDQSFIIYDEDCGSESCDDSNKLLLNIDMFDTFDVEDEVNQLTLFIDHDNIGDDYTTDGDLGILINQDYNSENEGVIQVPIYITDSENAQSEIFTCDIVINPVNDEPFFSNLGDIIFDEDQTYQEDWAFDISTGAYNEEQQLFFIVTFQNPELIESYTLAPNGNFTIIPVENAFGETTFDVYAQDEGFLASEVSTHNLTINPINDNPTINDQSFIIYDEDCGSESCDDSNKLLLNIDMFDTFDVEDEVNQLTLFIDHDNIGDDYTTDGDLGILINQDYNSENEGVIQVPIYITDSENAQSEIFTCDIVINPVNDEPFFSNLGDIIINEDNNYYQNWAFDISTGAYNENQDLIFTVIFDNPDLIENYSLDSEGYFSINPNLNANGQSTFNVYLTDELSGESESFTYQLVINPVNDFPLFDFSPDSYTIDEDSGLHTINWAYNINPGGGNGQFIEDDQEINFVIENTYDETLFSINPEININELNQGILTFMPDTNMNGSTNFFITLQDNGDNKLDDDDDTNDGYNISETVNFPLQINQINDISLSFDTFSDLRLYQLNPSTFYTFENEDIYFRYPYQSVYLENQLPDNLRFEWEWIDSLDIDIYPEINKDILMENVFYRLEAVQVLNPNNIITLVDSIIYNVSNSDLNYEIDLENNLARIDVDLTQISGLDRSGLTEYHWRVVSQNYQFDYLNSDPQFFTDDDYSFYIDITLPNVNMIPLYDDIFSENFDLYMLGSERLIDFDGYSRPIKLWVDYGINGSDDEILFPIEIDSTNYIYFLPYTFSSSGDSRLRYQMRDHVQNINAGIEDISFSVINPINNSTLNFFNGFVNLEIPKNSFDQTLNCFVKKSYQNIDIDKYQLVGNLINIYPHEIKSNNKIELSFDLKILDSIFDESNLAIYQYDSNQFYYCDTFIENGYLKTTIDNFGIYGIFYDDYHNTEQKMPEHFILNHSYPNPFNPSTTINYYLPNDNFIEISIYNIKGEKVRNLVSNYINSGYHSIIWDGKNDYKDDLPSGVYLINLSYNNNIETHKVIKIK